MLEPLHVFIAIIAYLKHTKCHYSLMSYAYIRGLKCISLRKTMYILPTKMEFSNKKIVSEKETAFLL